MKKKIISVILVCFIVISSSVNCFATNKDIRFADGGVISAPMVAVLITLAVGTGISIENDNQIYNVANDFYQKNKENWEAVNTLFDTCVSIGANKVVTIGKEFATLCREFFDNVFDKSSPEGSILGYYGSIPIYDVSFETTSNNDFLFARALPLPYNDGEVISYTVGDLVFYGGKATYKGTQTTSTVSYASDRGVSVYIVKSGSSYYLRGYWLGLGYMNSSYRGKGVNYGLIGAFSPTTLNPTFDNYSWEMPKDEDIRAYVPGNVSDLVGTGSKDVIYGNTGTLNPPYDLPIGGTVTLPGVLNPSIDSTLTGEFVETDVDVDTDTDVDTDVGVGDITFPSFGDSLDFSPFELSGITERFPFSLPWDIGRLIGSLDVEPKAPVFDIPIVSEKIKLDLSSFDDWANIVRWFLTLSLIATLIYISVRLKG